MSQPFRLLLMSACVAVGSSGWMSPAASVSAADPDPAHQWGQWRGPLATGVAPHADPPTEWSEDKNVRWASRLPGTGHSTPVVWGNLVFVTVAVPYGEKVDAKADPDPGAHDNLPVTQSHRFLGLAFDRRTGEVLWQKILAEELPHEGGHHTGSLASHSPVTDGKRLFAFFGSHCFGHSTCRWVESS